MNNEYRCATAPKFIFACSGAADLAEIRDRTTRWLTKQGKGKTHCLVEVRSRVADILVNVRVAQKNLALGDCPTQCAKQKLLQAGFNGFEHLQLKELKLNKGKSTPTFANKQVVVNRKVQILA